MGRAILLWMLGVPIWIIILLAVNRSLAAGSRGGALCAVSSSTNLCEPKPYPP